MGTLIILKMGNCALQGNCSKSYCNQNCCKNHNQKMMINLEDLTYNEPYYLDKFKKIQSFYKGYRVRKNVKGKLNFIGGSIGIPIGKEYDIIKNPINLSPNIVQMEKAIGNFSTNEKETLQPTGRLRKYCIRLKDNSIYHGYLTDNWKKEGFGILYTEDGCKYEGYFFNDLKHGQGRMLHTDGYYYEGYFENGKTNGFGKYVNLDGTMYIGYWKDEKQHGFGEEIFNDYSRYEGNYEFGKKNGKGKFTWPDGSFYEGDFKDGEIEGYGVYCWKDGRIYQGTWVKNQMHGKGLFVWPDKKKYEGEYINDKKEGYGIFYWPDCKKYEGYWKDGKQHGFGIFSVNGIKQYGEWNDGKKIRNMNNETERIKEGVDLFAKPKNLNNLNETLSPDQKYIIELSLRSEKMNFNKLNINNI